MYWFKSKNNKNDQKYSDVYFFNFGQNVLNCSCHWNCIYPAKMRSNMTNNPSTIHLEFGMFCILLQWHHTNKPKIYLISNYKHFVFPLFKIQSKPIPRSGFLISMNFWNVCFLPGKHGVWFSVWFALSLTQLCHKNIFCLYSIHYHPRMFSHKS